MVELDGGEPGAPSQNARREPRLSVLGGGTRLSGVLREPAVAVVALAFLLLVAVGGCGESEGVAEGATVTAYVEAPLCAGAKQELVRQGGRAGELRVQAVCLPSATTARKLDLATLGANARQAIEDSTTVAYLEASDPRASRFTDPILESANVAWISASSGKQAMARLLRLIEASGAGSLRESIRDELNE